MLAESGEIQLFGGGDDAESAKQVSQSTEQAPMNANEPLFRIQPSERELESRGHADSLAHLAFSCAIDTRVLNSVMRFSTASSALFFAASMCCHTNCF